MSGSVSPPTIQSGGYHPRGGPPGTGSPPVPSDQEGSIQVSPSFVFGKLGGTVPDKDRAAKRKRAANACLRCKSRKQRCDGMSIPCKNCEKAGAPCHFPEEVSGEQALREHIALLEGRLQDVEGALAQFSPHHPALTPLEGLLPRKLSDGADIMPHLAAAAAARDSSRDRMRLRDSSRDRFRLRDSSRDRMRRTDSDSTRGKQEVDEDDLVDGIGFLSLTSGAEPLYVGGSSGAQWGRIFNSALRRNPTAGNSLLPRNQPSFGMSPPQPPKALRTPIVFPPLPPPALADELIQTVYMTVQPRYCFMNWPALRLFHGQRDMICGGQEVEAEGMRTAAFFLWISYALGARLMQQNMKAASLPPHEEYFRAAMVYFDHVHSTVTTIQALLFLAMYSFRCEHALSTWHLGGLAMRMAIELGLHRNRPPKKQTDAFSEETRKRVWWSVYSLERVMAFQLGRPMMIQDRDIDVDLPADIDCNLTSAEGIRGRQRDLATSSPRKQITSMSSSLHYVRLRCILGRIKETVYSPSPQILDLRRVEVDGLMGELEDWRHNIPKASGDDVLEPHGMPLCDEDWFELQYHNAVLSLLMPLSLNAPIGDETLARCTRSAAMSCQIQRQRLQQGSKTPLSFYSLHKIFMSGLWLLYATGLDPDVIPRAASSRAIRACSNALFIYAASFESARAYAECFESLVAERCDEPPSISQPTNQAPLDSTPTQQSHLAGVSAPAPISFNTTLAPAPTATPEGPSSWDGRFTEIASSMTGGMRDDFMPLLANLGFSGQADALSQSLEYSASDWFSEPPLFEAGQWPFEAPAVDLTFGALPPGESTLPSAFGGFDGFEFREDMVSPS